MTTLYHSSTSLLTFGTPIIADGDTDYYPNVVQKLEEASDVLGLVAAHVSTSGA